MPPVFPAGPDCTAMAPAPPGPAPPEPESPEGPAPDAGPSCPQDAWPDGSRTRASLPSPRGCASCAHGPLPSSPGAGFRPRLSDRWHPPRARRDRRFRSRRSARSACGTPRDILPPAFFHLSAAPACLSKAEWPHRESGSGSSFPAADVAGPDHFTRTGRDPDGIVSNSALMTTVSTFLPRQLRRRFPRPRPRPG